MSWFENIIEKITPSTNLPIIVLDYHRFLRFPEIQNRLKEEGYSLIFVETTLEVRIQYELEVRNKTKKILIINGTYPLVDDMKSSSFVVELKANDFFKNFDSKAISNLSFKELSRLEKIEIYKELNFNETRKIINEKIKTISKEQEVMEIKDLLNDLMNLESTITDEKIWFKIAEKIGECGLYVFKLQDDDLISRFNQIIKKLNDKFQQFIQEKYESLFTKSALKHPYTIDKILDFIAENSKNRKIALIVIDGMNYWQWTMLKHSLEKLSLNVENRTSFTWLPSITAWARQSIFKGGKPDINIDNRTESILFKKYWKEKHLKQDFQISYKSVKTSENINIPSSDICIAGFVFNALDEMMHGTILGNKQLYQSTELWIKQSKICESIKSLKNAGFDIYISTDHGNIEAKLNLKLSASEKAIINSRSKRFIQFDTEKQADDFIKNNTDFSLGKREKNVYFKDEKGFGSSNELEITHGGSHILELLIPVGVIK